MSIISFVRAFVSLTSSAPLPSSSYLSHNLLTRSETSALGVASYIPFKSKLFFLGLWSSTNLSIFLCFRYWTTGEWLHPLFSISSWLEIHLLGLYPLL
jgi:hypothetical protein